MQGCSKSLKLVRFFLGLAFGLLLSFSSFAATITIDSVSGVSDSDLDATTPVVYGAFSGSCENLAEDSGFNPTVGCAINPITSGTTFQVCVSHDGTDDADFYLINDASSSATKITTVSTGSNIGSGTLTCITALWSSICGEVDTDSTNNDSTCNSVIDNQIYVLADYGDDGSYDSGTDIAKEIDIKANSYDLTTEAAVTLSTCTSDTTDKPCVFRFSLIPGDAKAIIEADGNLTEAVSANSGFTTASNHLSTKYVRFIFTTGASCTADFEVDSAITAGNYRDIEITTDSDGSASLTTNYITGLTNSTQHCFRVATVDEAGNVGYFLEPDSIDGTSGTASNYQVTPEEVYGIFENSRCFIATAAYGDPSEKHLVLLRSFRDQVLQKYAWGQKFIHFYYTYSPEWALWLLKNESFKPIVRTLLLPAYAFAKLSLEIGFFSSLLISILFIAFIVASIQQIRRRVFS